MWSTTSHSLPRLDTAAALSAASVTSRSYCSASAGTAAAWNGMGSSPRRSPVSSCTAGSHTGGAPGSSATLSTSDWRDVSASLATSPAPGSGAPPSSQMPTSRATCSAVSGASPVSMPTLWSLSRSELMTMRVSARTWHSKATKPANIRRLSTRARGHPAGAPPPPPAPLLLRTTSVSPPAAAPSPSPAASAPLSSAHHL
mmetsp:Transcript_3788/g.14045  ORF Transcript_3788/g.14045 Transcript_3788/m.14045 type:complete len:200 (+) Transcript_3788:247-846(+)